MVIKIMVIIMVISMVIKLMVKIMVIKSFPIIPFLNTKFNTIISFLHNIKLLFCRLLFSAFV